MMTNPDTGPDAAARAFDTQLANRVQGLEVTAESAEDRTALRDLFAACAPHGALLAGPLLELQFASQDATFRANRPLAMRRVLRLSDTPIARVILDWHVPGASYGVDIAVHPDHRASGAGLAMLRAWIAVADAQGRACILDVIAQNPARMIYRRLGFVEQPCPDDAPFRHMMRAAQT
jgi:ribosomal protein S18 acetylase RimI-like enzyme